MIPAGPRQAWWFGVLAAAAITFQAQVRAVLFQSTADPAFNASAPTGSLAGSGWEWEGQWGLFLGTPIVPNFFITAQHVGGVVGGLFVLNGVAHVTTAYFDDPSSDLRIWQIADTFSGYAPQDSRTAAFAPLFTSTNEVGQFNTGLAIAAGDGNDQLAVTLPEFDERRLAYARVGGRLAESQ